MGWEPAVATALEPLYQPGSFWAETWDEALTMWSPILLGALVIAALLRRTRPGTHRTLRTTSILVFAHLASLPVLGVLASVDSAFYGDVRIVSLTCATLAGINVAAFILFDGLLPAVRIETPRILSDIVTAAAYIVAAVGLLSKTGINLSGLIATSAVLTAVIGFSLQDTLGNLMGGLALQLENTVRVGDWIKVGEFTGRVVEIRWRQTSIETRNWETVIFPNSALMKSQIVVLGRRVGEPVQWRRWIWFNVDFRCPPTDVIQAANDTFKAAIDGVSSSPEPHCLLMEMHDSYSRYALRYWLSDIARDDPTDSMVRTRLFFSLQRAGIKLSIPAHALFVTNDTEDRRKRKEHDDAAERRRAIGSVDIFRSLADEDLEELATGLLYSPYAAGETLTRQGDKGHHIYLIVEGKVSIRVAVGGREREVATLDAGRFFGERSLMTGEPRSATVVALTDVVCYRLDKLVFEKVLKRQPELAAVAADVLARRQAELQNVRVGLDAAMREEKLAENTSVTLAKIKAFFGL